MMMKKCKRDEMDKSGNESENDNKIRKRNE
jgi:hypothetical protein